MRGVRGGEDEGSRGNALIGEAVVDVVRGQKADAAVTVLVVVPVEEGAAVSAAVLCGSEALGKVGPVLERLALRFGEWVVVRDVRPRVALRDAEVRVQMRDHLRGHRRPAVSVDGQLAGGDSLPLAGLFDELLCERRALAVGDHPADDVAAEDVFAAVWETWAFDVMMAGDANADLMAMWKAAAAHEWLPPTVVTEDDYRARGKEPAETAFIGFGCSFGGKWFGGYARDGERGHRNYALTSACSTMNKVQAMHGRRLDACGFESWDSRVDAGTVVYCDPPYAGTTGYSAVGAFDHERFWEVARRWADRGAVVLVSEYAAPEGWTVAAEFEHRVTVSGGGDGQRTAERVFARDASAAA
jgi:DNA adenine methylase